MKSTQTVLEILCVVSQSGCNAHMVLQSDVIITSNSTRQLEH